VRQLVHASRSNGKLLPKTLQLVARLEHARAVAEKEAQDVDSSQAGTLKTTKVRSYGPWQAFTPRGNNGRTPLLAHAANQASDGGGV
jgi:hypothetical protein